MKYRQAGRQVRRKKAGAWVVQAIGNGLFRCDRRCQRSGFVIVEIEHRQFQPAHEIAKQRAQFPHRFVIERDVVQHAMCG